MISTEKAVNYIMIFLVAFFIILVLYFTKIMAAYVLPVFLAFFSAFSLSPILKKLHKTKVPNWASTLLVVFTFLILISILLVLLVISIQRFITDIPGIIKEIQRNSIKWLNTLSANPVIAPYISQEKLAAIILDNLSQINFQEYLMNSVNFFIDLIKGFFIYTVSLIFITPGMSRLEERVSKAFPTNKVKIYTLLKQINKQIQSYVIVKSIISIITGIITFFVCLLFGVKYSILWGFLAFTFNYVPYIGSTIAVIFPGILSLIQYQSFPLTISLVVVLTSMQILLGNILENKFQSKGVNLSPVVILISVMFWGYLWGVVGIIIAVPLMSAFNLICENIEQLKFISHFISSSEKS